jgi:hypothetical protein
MSASCSQLTETRALERELMAIRKKCEQLHKEKDTGKSLAPEHGLVLEPMESPSCHLVTCWP